MIQVGICSRSFARTEQGLYSFSQSLVRQSLPACTALKSYIYSDLLLPSAIFLKSESLDEFRCLAQWNLSSRTADPRPASPACLSADALSHADPLRAVLYCVFSCSLQNIMVWCRLTALPMVHQTAVQEGAPGR